MTQEKNSVKPQLHKDVTNLILELREESTDPIYSFANGTIKLSAKEIMQAVGEIDADTQ